MSIRWIRTVLIDNEPGSLEVFLGEKKISDKCYVRISGGQEFWFKPNSDQREIVLEQGKDLLKRKLAHQKITTAHGETFSWEGA